MLDPEQGPSVGTQRLECSLPKLGPWLASLATGVFLYGMNTTIALENGALTSAPPNLIRPRTKWT